VATKDTSTGRANPWLVILIALFFFLCVGAESSFGGWIYTYAVASGLSDKAVAAYLTSAFWGALTVGRLLAVALAMRLSPRSMLLIDLAGCLIGVGIVLAWPGSVAAIWLGTIGTGLSIASLFPTTISFAGSRMTITGQVTGWFFVGASLGSMSLPWLIGQLFESIGPRVTMLLIAADVMAAMGVFVALMLYSPRPVRKEETS
jgi:FHS family Na+ dependent glucose MFS transporter 1